MRAELPAGTLRPEVIPAGYSPWEDDPDWDDDPDSGWCDHDGPLSDCLRRLIDDVRHAADELDAHGPAGREVGRWLRRRAQQASLDVRRIGQQP